LSFLLTCEHELDNQCEAAWLRAFFQGEQWKMMEMSVVIDSEPL
jgi:hypothetical protein